MYTRPKYGHERFIVVCFIVLPIVQSKNVWPHFSCQPITNIIPQTHGKPLKNDRVESVIGHCMGSLMGSLKFASISNFK